MHKKCLFVFFTLCAFGAFAQEQEKTAADLAKEYDRPTIEIFGGWLLSSGVIEVGLDTFSMGLGYVDYAPILERNIGFAVFAQAVFPRELTYQVEESKKTIYKKSGDTAVWGVDFSIGMVRRLWGFAADTDAQKFGLWAPGFVGLRVSYFDVHADKGTTSESFQRIGLGLEDFIGLEFHPFRHFYVFTRVVLALDFASFVTKQTLTTTTSISGKIAYYVDSKKENLFIFALKMQPAMGIGIKF